MAIDTNIFGQMTGDHSLFRGFELQEGFSVENGPLDAPFYIAAGATIRYENWDGLTGYAKPMGDFVTRSGF